MAHAIANIHAPLGAVAILRVVDTVFELKAAFVEWNEQRLTRKVLAGLSDHQLEDIGLSRADF